jgi:hypothetical protein
VPPLHWPLQQPKFAPVVVEQDTAFPFGEQQTEFPPVPQVAVVLVGQVRPRRTHLYWLAQMYEAPGPLHTPVPVHAQIP